MCFLSGWLLLFTFGCITEFMQSKSQMSLFRCDGTKISSLYPTCLSKKKKRKKRRGVEYIWISCLAFTEKLRMQHVKNQNMPVANCCWSLLKYLWYVFTQASSSQLTDVIRDYEANEPRLLVMVRLFFLFFFLTFHRCTKDTCIIAANLLCDDLTNGH